MVEMDGGASSNQPQQISDMFQKFALAVKAKTYELFVEEDSDDDAPKIVDFAEEFIPDQKVVVIKPNSVSGREIDHPQVVGALIPSLFVTLASLEASYLQFQAAHVPEIDQDALESVDRAIVSILHKFTDMKKVYMNSKRGDVDSIGGFDFPARSFLEYQVQENQSKLRVLEMTVNSLQSQIEIKSIEVRNLRKNVEEIRNSNANLLHKLHSKDGDVSILLTVRVFEAMLQDSLKSLRYFSKMLIGLMREAGWDLIEAASCIYSGVVYSKRGHFRFAFLSYVCMGMFQDFDHCDFGLSDRGSSENGGTAVGINDYLKQLIEHVASNPMEILKRNPDSEFSQFCARKYEKLIHPTIESSIFSHLDRKGKVLESWKSLPVFYESFVRMTSSIWLLHKLAYSFNPTVKIFQVSTGTDFSTVYMEDVLSKSTIGKMTGQRVGFSVVPGFKVGKTIIQSQVYLNEHEG